MQTKQYPAGGPREPVYDLMRGLGFKMSNWSDKFWDRADGTQVAIYGAGSMARITPGDVECELDQLSQRLG